MRHYTILSVRMLIISASLLALLLPALLARADGGQRTYLPIVITPPASSPEQIALDRINYYRSLAGVPPLLLHPALVRAAQNHARYAALNYNDPSALVHGPHGEVAGKPGFTGKTSIDRAIATGFPYGPSGEVMGYMDDPQRAVDGLMKTVFHRKSILSPTHQFVGYGKARSADDEEAVDVIDFGKGANDPIGQPGILVFPAANQTDVPLYGTNETPSYLPPDAIYLVGFPITVQFMYGQVLTVSEVELRDGRGALVPLYENPALCETGCYAILPRAPLQPATTYTVHVAGTVDGLPFERSWSFMTQKTVAAAYSAQPSYQFSGM